MSSYRISLSSIANFNNIQTILVDYFLLPIISLGMFLLISYNSTQDYTRVLLGTIITTGIASSIGIISVSRVYDQNIGIIDDINSIQPRLRTYWLPKFVIAGITLLVEIIILASVGLLFIGKFFLLLKLLLYSPLIIIAASLLGYFAAQLGTNHNNPYWCANLLTSCLVLLSGVIIPVSQYPFWLKIIAELFPINDILDLMISPQFFNFIIIIIKLFSWWLICIIINNVIVKNSDN